LKFFWKNFFFRKFFKTPGQKNFDRKRGYFGYIIGGHFQRSKTQPNRHRRVSRPAVTGHVRDHVGCAQRAHTNYGVCGVDPGVDFRTAISGFSRMGWDFWPGVEIVKTGPKFFWKNQPTIQYYFSFWNFAKTSTFCTFFLSFFRVFCVFFVFENPKNRVCHFLPETWILWLHHRGSEKSQIFPFFQKSKKVKNSEKKVQIFFYFFQNFSKIFPKKSGPKYFKKFRGASSLKKFKMDRPRKKSWNPKKIFRGQKTFLFSKILFFFEKFYFF